MKSLLLLRHADALPAVHGGADRDRSLSDIGSLNACFIGQKILDAELRPDLIITSPALRTQQTACLVAGAMSYPIQDILQDERIYENTLSLLMETLHDVANSEQRIMLVGHNPTISQLLQTLSDSEHLHLNTACVAEIQFAIQDWSEITPHSGECRWFCAPE